MTKARFVGVVGLRILHCLIFFCSKEYNKDL
jgi:hypothetical protein